MRRNDDTTFRYITRQVLDPPGFSRWQLVVLRCVAIVTVGLCTTMAIVAVPLLAVIALFSVVLVVISEHI